MQSIRAKHGFTLIELLVVVAIIAALLAILMPSMGKAMHVAQMTVCLSNLKQSGTGFLSLAADNMGKYKDYGFNKPTELKFGANDARPDINPYVSLNDLMCPFTPEIDYINPPVANSHGNEWTYVWFAGWKFDFETDGLYRAGDTFKHANKTMKVLVADQLWTRIDGAFPHSSHPGRGTGMLTAGANTGPITPTVQYDANTYTFMRWQNQNVSFSAGGETDLNYMFNDLSGRMINRVTWSTTELEKVEFFRSAGSGWYLWVPVSQ